ncbi:MAG: hypothetical protein ACC661_08175, partial [Verrucomicrobiales bacterium]
MADTLVTSYRSDFSATQGANDWRYLWNAPTGWVAGSSVGDPATGEIGSLTSYREFLWDSGSSNWTPEGTPAPGGEPNGFLRIRNVNGHPGRGKGKNLGGGLTNGHDRFAIASYTVPNTGFYAITRSVIERVNTNGNGIQVLIHDQAGAPVLSQIIAEGTTADINTPLGYYSAGETVYICFGSNGSDASDFFALDLDISLLSVSAGGSSNLRTDFTTIDPPSLPWSYRWNAPDAWSASSSGDLESGVIGESDSYRLLELAGSVWTPDGDTDAGNGAPAGG